MILRVVGPRASFNISQGDISPTRLRPKIRLKASFLTLEKMAITFLKFSEISNNLGIKPMSLPFLSDALIFDVSIPIDFDALRLFK